MKVDNRLQTAKLKMFYLLIWGFIFSLSAYYFFEADSSIVYPILLIAVITTYIVLLLRRSNYFFMEYLGNKITVRYYTAHPIFRKYKAFEFPKSYFYDYKISKKFFGFIKIFQIIVKTPKGRFNYPPLSISLLTKQQTEDLIKLSEELKH